MRDEDVLEIARYALKTSDESLTEQYDEVQSVRLRASFLITVNALSSTLFAQLLDAQLQIDFFLAAAVILFVVCNVVCLLVMMPSGTWRITKSGRKIVEQFLDTKPDLTAGEVLGILAIKADEDQVRNEGIVSAAHTQFFYAVVAFAASTVCWLFNLGIPSLFMEGP